MARYIGPKGKISRREKTDLFLKSARRSLSEKCRFDIKPGQHGRISNTRISDYGIQLREKQKVKRIYGILERQFSKYFYNAHRKKGNTGEILLQILELRLDNIIYRMGFGSTRSESRQLVSHKSIKLNGKIVNIPSYQVKIGDIISIKEKSKDQIRISESILLNEKNTVSNWFTIDNKKLEGIIHRIPDRNEIYSDINESLIVELYSR